MWFYIPFSTLYWEWWRAWVLYSSPSSKQWSHQSKFHDIYIYILFVQKTPYGKSNSIKDFVVQFQEIKLLVHESYLLLRASFIVVFIKLELTHITVVFRRQEPLFSIWGWQEDVQFWHDVKPFQRHIALVDILAHHCSYFSR